MIKLPFVIVTAGLYLRTTLACVISAFVTNGSYLGKAMNFCLKKDKMEHKSSDFTLKNINRIYIQVYQRSRSTNSASVNIIVTTEQQEISNNDSTWQWLFTQKARFWKVLIANLGHVVHSCRNCLRERLNHTYSQQLINDTES